jgi:hypothetical protein
MDRNGERAPVYFDPPIADMAGALYATTAILGALIGREKTGQGVHIDLALADTLMPLQLTQLAGWHATGIVPKRRSSYLNGADAYYQVYETRDGRHVMLGAVEAKFWRAFCVTAGHEEWLDRQSEPSPQVSLCADVATYFSSLTLTDVMDRFSHVDCCLSAVANLAEAMTSDQISARGLVVEAGGHLQSLFPARFDGLSPDARDRMAASDMGTRL